MVGEHRCDDDPQPSIGVGNPLFPRQIGDHGSAIRRGFTPDDLKFAVAGAQAGFGLFLAAYLQQQGLALPATDLAGLAGPIATTLIGVVLDRTKAKRMGREGPRAWVPAAAPSIAGLPRAVACGRLAAAVTRAWVRDTLMKGSEP